MNPVTVIARSKAKPGFEPVLEAVIRAAVTPTHAEEGCLKYSFQRCLEDPSSYVIVEKWTSKEALDLHLTSPHIAELFSKLPDLLAGPPEIQLFESLDAGDPEKADIVSKYTTFVYPVYVLGTPEKVWQALVDPDLTEKYFFGRRVESSWRVGTPINFWEAPGKRDVFGKILKCEPGKTLSYTFEHDQDTLPREKSTVATFELSAVGNATRLRLVHEHLLPRDVELNPHAFLGVNNGWPAILSNLKNVVETGKSLEFGS